MRIVSAITAALALVLVVAITAVACSGGSDNSSTAAGGGTSSASKQTSRSSASSSPRAQDEECTPLDATAAAEYVRDFRYTLNGPSTKSIGLFVEQAIALPGEFTGLNQVANPGDVDNGDGGLRAQALVQLADGEHVAVRYDTSTKTGPGNPEPNGVGGEEVSVQVSADGTVGTTSRTPLAGTAHTALPTWTGANAVKSSTGYVTMLNSLPGMADFNGRDISFDRPVQILSMVPGPDSAEVFFLPDLIRTNDIVRPQLAPTLYRGRLYDYTAARKTAARNSGGYSITQQAARTACGL
ncbi:hypothetical protein [Tsukamurella paurometabola]|uniref:Lipoprotein n=1 Tax=Tsukamurella paurometabola TaxID=2061 RepID=A0ABS5NFK4_TSUPA|nr:hypothetical protein [Tsukamurella paurometabola]MBS4103081.1 hypothetical protein [Tsukamurella paurometabola]